MKYIRFKHGEFILFSRNLIHAEVARAAASGGGPPVSAGFVVKGTNGELACKGQSDSLRLVADLGDTKRLREFLGSVSKMKGS
jgi:hypothetical protein